MSGEGPGVAIRELVHARMPLFTPSERKLARALLSAYPIAGLEPLSKLATRAGVSAPTALRLVAKLGFDGYPSFQQQLRQEVQLRIDSPVSRYTAPIRMTSELPSPEAEFRILFENLEATAEGLDFYEFNTVVELLSDSRRRVIVLGGVVSRVIATHLVHRLTQLRPGVTLLPETSSAIFDQVVDLRRGDLVVAFDYKRYQHDTNVFLRRAARDKVTIILCTDHFNLCPALEVASHVLTCSVDGPRPFDSPIGGFALVEVLASGVATRLGDAGRRRIARLEAEDSDWMWDHTLLAGVDAVSAEDDRTDGARDTFRGPSHSTQQASRGRR
jgi:DNA-binding MurR/RpiR family transcriptional regulator